MATTSLPLDLAAATADLHAAVDRFNVYVKEQTALFPEHWPEKLTNGEWFEQFMAFLTSGFDDGASDD